MKRFLSFLFGFPAFVLLAAFALANRKWVTVSFDPLTPDDPLFSVQVPLWAVLFAGIFLGLVAGGIATWIRQGKWRRRARRARFDLEEERMQRERLQKRLEEAARSDAPNLPGPSSLPRAS